MRSALLLLSAAAVALGVPAQTQTPLAQAASSNHSSVSNRLFIELEELARVVDISYCVGTTGLGIQKPFQCASRCGEFENFELITTWNTGPLLSDSCGYIAVSHPPSAPRILLAFRGTYSIANTIIDLSTIPQEYVPYPGDDDDGTEDPDFVDPKIWPDEDSPPPADPPKCTNCTVHTGFYTSWLNTRKEILPHLTEAINNYPNYTLTLVGHSLGGAVAALAGLDFEARGWDPHVTTFGEPRVGNKEFMEYINNRFDVANITPTQNDTTSKYRRVTHQGDPVPLLPLDEWGYKMHSEEIFIKKWELPPTAEDIQHCNGDEDPACITGDEAENPSWGVPARFKLWQLFFAHRDYFWRLGLCVPGGDPKDWYRKYPHLGGDDETPEL
ncbi:alpha/beta-hydrolase [Mytilinidion resinicola]|uniref:Alpha/beta-hydrolase n=1 Tax=Mytilinidion resinicola TaxID=574789 RepID=A0A6A6YMB1_9PEZI|nr:alpha/beta-hydrolase [Mytilinidion resinicola]KAF2810012.1 alpha/beta-hydrolase [Mytilinidion resinicola]